MNPLMVIMGKRRAWRTSRFNIVKVSDQAG
jgi:hypothetical protein